MSDYQLTLIVFNLYFAVLNKNNPIIIFIMTVLWGVKLVFFYFK